MQPSRQSGRALMAVVLYLGFYCLALAMAGGLIWLGMPDEEHQARTVLCWTLAAFVLFAVRPRRIPFFQPGLRLQKEHQPELFAELEALARATGQDMPKEVYLIPDVNAFVGERRTWFGLRRRQLIGIGLPLMQLLNRAELRAVLGHEFGHFAAGDERLGPWIHRTRTALANSVEYLSQRFSLLSLPFRIYGRMFVRLTHSASRRQELAADALAAKIVGPDAKRRALRKVYGMAGGFEPYFRDEVFPVLQEGMRPPLALGWAMFLENNAEAVQQSFQTALEAPIDPEDSHPPLGVRLDALDGLPAVAARQGDEDPAISLLRDRDELEAWILAFMVEAEEVAGYECVPWLQTAQLIYPPKWQRHLSQFGHHLKGMTFRDAAQAATRLEALGQEWNTGHIPPDEEAMFAGWTIGAAMATTLQRAGWELETEPGRAIRMLRDDEEFDAFGSLPEVERGEKSVEELITEMERLGIADLPIRGNGNQNTADRAVEIQGV